MAKKVIAKQPAASNPPAPAAADPMLEIRSKLLNRLAVAGGMVLSLLAILAFFDYLATPPDEPEARVFSRPVPVAPKKEVSQPVTPATNLPEPPVVAQVKPADPEPPAVPVAEAPPAPAPQAIPDNKVLPETPRTGRGKPVSGKVADAEAAPERTLPRPPALRHYALPSVPASTPALPAGRARLPETPSDITAAPAINPETRTPSARVLQVQSAPPVVPPSTQRLFSGFLLQAGTFSSAQRAEELHAKLTLSGVPSTLETRVQVGPFKTRQEAEAAQERLRELGIGSILVAPKGSKH